VNRTTIDSKAANRLVEAVFKQDSRVRYCGVVDYKGRETAGGMRSSIEPLTMDNENVTYLLQHIIHLSMVQTWDKRLGPTDYVILHRGKVMLFIFPLPGGDSLLVSLAPDSPLEFVTTISGIIQGISNAR
jgi:hypothetical protein